jgi:hypothetical protein
MMLKTYIIPAHAELGEAQAGYHEVALTRGAFDKLRLSGT